MLARGTGSASGKNKKSRKEKPSSHSHTTHPTQKNKIKVEEQENTSLKGRIKQEAREAHKQKLEKENEQAFLIHKEQQTQEWINRKVVHIYILSADPDLTTRHNAVIFLQSIMAWYYFDKQCNLAFHDLITIKTPPQNLCSLLGLGLKFCPAPRYTTYKIGDALPQFDNDVCLKTYSSGAEDYDYNPKMYMKGNFVPPDFMIPKEILH
eukprot:4541623-Ditylum_brightwellii.AAC.1